MVQKFIIDLIIKNAASIGKSVVNAYKRVVAQQGGAAGSSAAGGGFSEQINKMKEKSGMLGGKTMTRDEALKILNIEDEP